MRDYLSFDRVAGRYSKPLQAHRRENVFRFGKRIAAQLISPISKLLYDEIVMKQRKRQFAFADSRRTINEQRAFTVLQPSVARRLQFGFASDQKAQPGERISDRVGMPLPIQYLIELGAVLMQSFNDKRVEGKSITIKRNLFGERLAVKG